MLDFLFWLAMAGVLMLGWPEFEAWLAVRKFRKQLKEYENEHGSRKEDGHLPHL